MKLLLEYGKSDYKKEFIQLWFFEKPVSSFKSEVYVNMKQESYYMFLHEMKFLKNTQSIKQSFELIKSSIEGVNCGFYIEVDIPETEITEELFLKLFHEHMSEVFL